MAAARNHDGGAEIPDRQAGAVRVAQATAQGHHGVVHRAVAQPVPVVSALATEPVDKSAHALLIEVAQTLLGSEVRKRAGDEQAPVLAAGAIVDDVMGAATGIVIDPLQREAVQRGPRTPRGLPRRGAGLDLARRQERRRRSPALPAVLDIDGHPPRPARIDAGRRGPHQRRRHLRAARHCHPGCHPAVFASATQTLGSPATTGHPTRRPRARPRGFEPLTFGSVDRRGSARFGLAKANFGIPGRQQVAKNQNR
jgi:hypothetical protein